MKSIKLAVFGHYDSRGGTTAMPLPPKFTEADITKALREYNKVFEWEESLKEYRTNPESWDWNPTEPGSSPGEQDFLYIADLHYDGELPDGDLEATGSVLIDPNSEPDYGKLPERDMDGGPYHGDWSFAHKVAESMQAPTQLEYVPVRPNVPMPEGGIEYGTPEMEAYDAAQHEAEAKVVAQAKYISNAKYTRWDDDAFGFIIGTGLEAQ